jgi:hypothetical protein
MFLLHPAGSGSHAPTAGRLAPPNEASRPNTDIPRFAICPRSRGTPSQGLDAFLRDQVIHDGLQLAASEIILPIIHNQQRDRFLHERSLKKDFAFAVVAQESRFDAVTAQRAPSSPNEESAFLCMTGLPDSSARWMIESDTVIG